MSPTTLCAVNDADLTSVGLSTQVGKKSGMYLISTRLDAEDLVSFHDHRSTNYHSRMKVLRYEVDSGDLGEGCPE